MTTTVEGNTPKRRPGRPTKAEAQDTKAALQRAALRLFARQGFAGTSIRAIAREVGLSESVLYAHFASKQAIFDAVLAEVGPRASVSSVAGVDPGLADTDPPRYLRELVRAVLDEWDTEDARLLISMMARDGLLHSAVLRDAVTSMRGAVAALFDRWMSAGLLSVDVGSPQDLAVSFTGPIGLIRVLSLHADATESERAAARAEILHHVDTFNRAVFR